MINYIYAERDALDYPVTKRILEQFKAAELYVVESYKDIFCRPNQNYRLQKDNPALILAVNHTGFIYKGAENCQDFGNDDFFYCSCSKNCIFSCDYCYLQGMYRSGHIVVFVNIDDCLKETELLLEKRKKLYMCLSYDCDIFALEGALGYVRLWNDFAAENAENGFLAEVRTKGASTDFFKNNQPNRGMVFAWTLSPQSVISRLEKRTAPVQKRLEAAVFAARKGFRVRLCFDPLIDTGDGSFIKDYEELAGLIEKSGIGELVDSASVGPFRVPAEYIKLFRHNAPQSPISWCSYTVENGTASYEPERLKEMNRAVSELLTSSGIPIEKIYGWEGKKRE